MKNEVPSLDLMSKKYKWVININLKKNLKFVFTIKLLVHIISIIEIYIYNY